MRYARVIVDVNHANVDRIFDYKTDGLELKRGQCVLVPFGSSNKKIDGYVLEVTDRTEFDEAKLKSVIRPIGDYASIGEELISLAYMIKKRYHTTLACALRLILPSPVRNVKVSEKKENFYSLNDDIDIDEFIAEKLLKKNGEPKSPAKLRVIEMLINGEKTMAELGSRSAINELMEMGAVVCQKRDVFRMPKAAEAEYKEITLNEEQQTAYKNIKKGINLLFGVTGSGKTEVYIKKIKDVIASGKTVIVLVPEISLTPQLAMMFRRRIKAPCAFLHSRLSDGERLDEWRRIASGDAKLIIGARSAVFAPAKQLGMIIIDEEHEQSYTADNHPRYDAREIAFMRAQNEDADVILCSATPSIESYYEAVNGRYNLIKLSKRAFEAKLPQIKITDMRHELAMGNKSMFSGILIDEIRRTLKEKKQLMLFLNRRGYSTFVMCRGCGYIEKCEECDISMTYHKAKNTLKCHYCGREKQVRTVCPECGKPYLKYFGGGTQKVEEEVKRFFPEARIIRMDLDTMGTKDAHLKAYEAFMNKQADILLGTQIIAKGLDFEDVRLTGIISADASLNFPDYQSGERTFQILTQVSGRAGRRGEGISVIQTYNPENYAIRYASKGDYEGFFKEEIAYRKNAMLPPFADFVLIRFESVDIKDCEAACERYYEELKAYLKQSADKLYIFDRGPAGVSKIKGKFRYNVLIKCDRKLTEKVIDVLSAFSYDRNYKNCVYEIIKNPKNLM